MSLFRENSRLVGIDIFCVFLQLFITKKDLRNPLGAGKVVSEYCLFLSASVEVICKKHFRIFAFTADTLRVIYTK